MAIRISSRQLTPSLLQAALGGAVALLPACFDLERTNGFGEGEIRVAVVDGEGSPVAGARVAIEGARQAALTDDTGLAVVGGLVVGDYAIRVAVDADADGVPEAGAVRGEASIRLAPLRRVERLTTFELPTTTVVATDSVSGTVTGCGAGELCRVVAFRHITLGTAGGRSREVALPIEGTAGVSTDGSWRIDGLLPGTVTVLATAYTKSVATQPLQQMIAASRPLRFAVVDVDVGADAIALAVDTDVPDSVTATLEVAAAPDKLERLQGDVDYLVPGSGTEVSPGLRGAFGGLSVATPTVEIDIPVSVFDLSAQADGVVGQVAAMAGVPGIGALLPIVLGLPAVDDTACVDADEDCLCDLVDPFPGCASNDPAECTPAAPIVCE